MTNIVNRRRTVSPEREVEEIISMTVVRSCGRLSRRSQIVLSGGLSISTSTNSCRTPFQSLHHFKRFMSVVGFDATYVQRAEIVIKCELRHDCVNKFDCIEEVERLLAPSSAGSGGTP